MRRHEAIFVPSGKHWVGSPEAALAALAPMLNDEDADFALAHPELGDVQIYRLREGIERFLITDINNPAASAQAQSELAAMWDIVMTVVEHFNHIPGGANVLFLDGHVEFIRYPSETFPVTEEFAFVGSSGM